MTNWLEDYNEATPKTKSFVLTWIVYSLVLLITTVYCYARLDYVRSYKSEAAIRADNHTPTQN